MDIYLLFKKYSVVAVMEKCPYASLLGMQSIAIEYFSAAAWPLSLSLLVSYEMENLPIKCLLPALP